MTQDVRDLIADVRGAMTERDDTGWFWVGRLVDALEVSLGERDAATEELEAQLTNAKAGWDSALRIVNEGNEIIKQVGAERDVAVAAIERVRAVLFKRYTGSPGFEDTPEHVKEIDALRDLYGEGLADDLLAALDGVPEPEWEYHVGWRNQDGSIHTNADEFDSDEWGDGSLEEAKELYEGEKSLGISNALIARRRRAGEWEEVPE